MEDTYDVVIVGGGPAGLSAALALGRARRRVLLLDGGPRRNQRAVHLQNFVTRDGVPPEEFRREARAQLARYETVRCEEGIVAAIGGARGDFTVTLAGARTIAARRVLLAVGMIDGALPIPGFAEAWGRGVVQCPYCHGWESRDRPLGFLARPEHGAHLVPFALQLLGWSRDVTVYRAGDAPDALPAEARALFAAAGVAVEDVPVERLVLAEEPGDGLAAIALADGRQRPCALLFAHPPQRQTPLVEALALALDEQGFVVTDPSTRETSRPGIYAAGDLTSRMQAAIAAAAAGTHAAATIHVDLALAAAASSSR